MEGRKLAVDERRPWAVPAGILAMLLGCIAVYSALFGAGSWIYGRTGPALLLSAVAIASGFALTRVWRRLALL